jgi:hypothetical protein
MKFSNYSTLLFVVAATALILLKDRRGVPETETRTVAALETDVVGAEDVGTHYVLCGENGPIVVSSVTTVWDAISRVRIAHDAELPSDVVGIGLVIDPADSTRALVAAWKSSPPQPVFELAPR